MAKKQSKSGKSGSKKKPTTSKKPRASIKVGKEAHKARTEEEREPPSIWEILVRLLPVWILLIAVLLLEPALPLRAISGAFRAVREMIPEEQVQVATVPAAIIQDVPQAPPTAVAELPPPASGHTGIAPIFTPEVQAWADEIVGWSEQYGVDANLIATLMQIESCGNPVAQSTAGKLGLFQVQPGAFDRREDPLDPDTNAQRALERFADLRGRTGDDLPLAFAAYNGGTAVLNTSPADWPQETQRYQFWASGIYEEAQAGLRQSPTLFDWYTSGGANLCAQAADVLGLD